MRRPLDSNRDFRLDVRGLSGFVDLFPKKISWKEWIFSPRKLVGKKVDRQRVVRAIPIAIYREETVGEL